MMPRVLDPFSSLWYELYHHRLTMALAHLTPRYGNVYGTPDEYHKAAQTVIIGMRNDYGDERAW
jgi:hypothetical protein